MIEKSSTFIPSEQNKGTVGIRRALNGFDRFLNESHPVGDRRDVRVLILELASFYVREIGEPSRKAMIVGFARQQLRARTVGLYYLVRSLSITPASVIGGLLWKVRPETTFVTAGIIGLLGTLLFAISVKEQDAG